MSEDAKDASGQIRPGDSVNCSSCGASRIYDRMCGTCGFWTDGELIRYIGSQIHQARISAPSPGGGQQADWPDANRAAGLVGWLRDYATTLADPEQSANLHEAADRLSRGGQQEVVRISPDMLDFIRTTQNRVGSDGISLYLHPAPEVRETAVEGWRPISDDARRGHNVLLGWVGERWAHPGRWNGRYWLCDEDGAEFPDLPTHWQPLPPAPEPDEEGETE